MGKFKFRGKTCKSCAFYVETPGHKTWNICVNWPPSSTAINQFAIYPHVDEDFIACSFYEELTEEPDGGIDGGASPQASS